MPKVAFGLSFDVRMSRFRKSGWKPAYKDAGAGLLLFAQPRLLGFRAALETGWAERIVLAGGIESRYSTETLRIGRAAMIGKMLTDDYGIDPARVTCVVSRANTGGNIAAIKAEIETAGLAIEECAVLTNLYHCPRASEDLRAAGLAAMPVYPAESLWLMQARGGVRQERKRYLVRQFGGNILARLMGGGGLAYRMAEEIQGIAQKLENTYAPLMDTQW